MGVVGEVGWRAAGRLSCCHRRDVSDGVMGVWWLLLCHELVLLCHGLVLLCHGRVVPAPRITCSSAALITSIIPCEKR